MKKIILMLAVIISTLTAFASEEKVSPRVLEAFQNEFATAKEVSWSAGDNYFKAEFVFNEQHVSAYYNTEGELLGLARFITTTDLPMYLQTSLKKNYDGFWISDLFEVMKTDHTDYYITLENADTKVIMKAGSDQEWTVYKKVKKI
jgi:hypothetical protein